MAKVIIYTKDHCPYCTLAKNFFTTKQIKFTEIHVDQDAAQLEEMIRLSNRRSVPQIFINNQPIGGYDDLAALAKSGKLDGLLNN